MIEQSLICKVLEAPDLEILHANGVIADMFLTSGDEVEFIINHYNTCSRPVVLRSNAVQTLPASLEYTAGRYLVCGGGHIDYKDFGVSDRSGKIPPVCFCTYISEQADGNGGLHGSFSACPCVCGRLLSGCLCGCGGCVSGGTGNSPYKTILQRKHKVNFSRKDLRT